MRNIRKIHSLAFLFATVSAALAISIFGLPAGIYAANMEIKLPSSDGSDAFEVQDSTGKSLMDILSDGNVGIGPSNPVEKFQVEDDFYVDSSLNFTGVNRNTRVSTSEYFGVQAPTVGTSYGGMYIRTDSATGKPFYGYNTGTETAWTYLDGSTGNLNFYNDGNRMTITDTGNVGIGDTAPDGKLEVNPDGTEDNGDEFVVDSNGYVGIGTVSPQGPFQIFTDDDGAGREATLLIDGFHTGTWSTSCVSLNGRDNENSNYVNIALQTSGGNVGIGTTSPGNWKLYVNGSAGGTGSWNGSDRRWKKNIQTIPDALKKVLALHGVNYRWKDGSDNGSLQMGMIAQEVEEVVPEVVHTANDGMKTKAIEYQYLVGLLVEAVKELRTEKDAEIAAINAENKQLMKTLTSLTDRQEAIEDMLLALSTTPSKEKLVKLDKHKHIFKPVTDKIRNSKIDVNQ